MRLLVWNINNFSLSKIYEPTGGWPPQTPESAHRLAHILNHIEEGNPDIFIIIEARSSQGALGSLEEGEGANGALLLLQCLRERQALQRWCLVPPLRIIQQNVLPDQAQRTEAICVYYKSATLDFIGPYIWPAVGAVSVPDDGTASGPHPAPWGNALPAGNTYAGQARFFDVDFGTELQFGGSQTQWQTTYKRKPFLTKFRAIADGRIFTIVTSHPSPSNRDPQISLSNLVHISDLKRVDQAANEIVVLAGDFNININDPTPLEVAGLYIVRDKGYSAPRIGPDVTLSTMIRNANPPQGTPPDEDEAAKPNGYLSTSETGIGKIIDNFFLRYAPRNPAAMPLGEIVDMVRGVEHYPSDMAQSLEELQGNTPAFRQLQNYGHIGLSPGTSDHLAISIDL